MEEGLIVIWDDPDPVTVFPVISMVSVVLSSLVFLIVISKNLYLIFFSFIAIGSITVLNLIIAVLVDVVTNQKTNK